jgi:hypothetical protein
VTKIASGESAANSAAYLRRASALPEAHPHVATVGPAQLLHSLQERRDASLSFPIVRRQVCQHADAPHSLGLLRACGERPRGRPAAEKANELTSPHIRTQGQEAALYRFKRVL